MRSVAALVLLAAAFAIATAVLGWWAVPVVAAAWALVRRGLPRSGALAAAGAALGWAALLAWAALRGPVGTLAGQLAGVFGVPAAALPLVALVFAALLAWSAAHLTSALVAGRTLRH